MTYTVPAGTYGDYSTAFIQAYIDQKIADVVGLAPATLDTLGELADALGDDAAYFSTIAAQVAELNTDVSDIVTALGVVENDQDFGAFTAATLTDTTTLKAVLEAFASAYETTKGNLESADTGLSNRLGVLEADPTTATAVAAGDAATLVSANAYTDTSVSNLLDSAPGVLDTLNELAAAIGDDADFIGTVNASIAAVQSDVDQNELDSDAAESALSGRLDTLEADPTTATAVAAVQSNLDTESGVRASADIALDGRLDTLEADPTTQTAVDAKLNIANPAATGDLTVDTEARLEFDSNLTKLHNDLRGTRVDIGNNITVYPAAAGGRFEIEGGLYIRLSDLVEANNDSSAATAGVVVGGVYYDNNGHLKIRRS